MECTFRQFVQYIGESSSHVPASDAALPVALTSSGNHGGLGPKPHRVLPGDTTHPRALSKVGADEDIRAVSTYSDVG